MEPNTKGEVSLILKGRKVILRPSFEVMLACEDHFQKSIVEIAQVFGVAQQAGKLPLTRDCLAILYCAFAIDNPTVDFAGFCRQLWDTTTISNIQITAAKFLFSMVTCGRQDKLGEGSGEEVKTEQPQTPQLVAAQAPTSSAEGDKDS